MSDPMDRDKETASARLRRELAEVREAYRDADDRCRTLEAEVARLEARVAGLRRIAENCGEGTDCQIGCPRSAEGPPPGAPCLAVTAPPGTDEFFRQMEAVCMAGSDDNYSPREHAGRCWADVWEHEQGLPWPTHEEDRP